MGNSMGTWRMRIRWMRRRSMRFSTRRSLPKCVSKAWLRYCPAWPRCYRLAPPHGRPLQPLARPQRSALVERRRRHMHRHMAMAGVGSLVVGGTPTVCWAKASVSLKEQAIGMGRQPRLGSGGHGRGGRGGGSCCKRWSTKVQRVVRCASSGSSSLATTSLAAPEPLPNCGAPAATAAPPGAAAHSADVCAHGPCHIHHVANAAGGAEHQAAIPLAHKADAAGAAREANVPRLGWYTTLSLRLCQ